MFFWGLQDDVWDKWTPFAPFWETWGTGDKWPTLTSCLLLGQFLVEWAIHCIGDGDQGTSVINTNSTTAIAVLI